jgi:hypothetical protein
MIAIVIFSLFGCATISQESKNTVIISQRLVVEKKKPILYVYHDASDQWQFLASEDKQMDEVIFLSLEDIISIDNSIKQISDLPKGWRAWRETKDQSWKRSKL